MRGIEFDLRVVAVGAIIVAGAFIYVNGNTLLGWGSKGVIDDVPSGVVSPVVIEATVKPILSVTKTVQTSSYSGDIGNKVNSANADCGMTTCEIQVTEAGPITTPIVLSENRILNFKGAHYTVAAIIFAGSNNEVKGLGIDKTVLERDPSFYAGKGSDRRTSPFSDFNQIDRAEIINISGKSKVYLHDFTIDGATEKVGSYSVVRYDTGYVTGKPFNMPLGKQPEIATKSSTDLYFKSLKIIGVQTNAISIVGINRATIESCELASNGWNAFQVLFVGVQPNTNILIKHNYIHDSSHAGIYIELADHAVIDGNLVSHNRVNTYYTGSGGGIGMQERAVNIAVINNKIVDQLYDDGSQFTLGHKGLPMLGHGIALHSSFTYILNNEIVNNEGAGINIKQGSSKDGSVVIPHDVVIKDNIIKNNGLKSLKIDLAINYDPNVTNLDIGDNDLTGQITTGANVGKGGD